MILNNYEKMIAKRYLLPGKSEGFIFVVAGFSVGAVALGVAALIIVMSVMNGFRAELFEKTAGLNGHAIIQGYDGRLADIRATTASIGRSNFSPVRRSLSSATPAATPRGPMISCHGRPIRSIEPSLTPPRSSRSS